MFSNSYQSGMHIELFNSQNKDLVKHWKYTGKIIKDYDAVAKGYVNVLNVAGVSKMQIPNNDKLSLGIVQSYIVFQMFVYSPKSLNIEIAISDTSKTKRRLMFSNSTKDIVINPLHSRIPLINIPIGVWVNLSIDVLSFVSECFKSQTFRSIDLIGITANCKIRKIFSMRSSLVEHEKNPDEDFQMEYAEILPKNLALPSNVVQENINLNIDRLKLFLEGEVKLSKENINSTSNIKCGSPLYRRHEPALKSSNLGKSINTADNYQFNILSQNANSSLKNNLRSKSMSKPAKNNNGELMNKQGFIDNFKHDSNSKSPREDYVNEKKNNLIFNKKKPLYETNKKMNENANINKMLKNNKINTYNQILNANKIKKLPQVSNGYNFINNKNSLNLIDNKSNILLSTLNYKNMEKWDNSKDNGGDSIEEIFEIDERRTQENILLEKDCKKDVESEKFISDQDRKHHLDESEDKYYYDIPIKDFKRKSQYKESGNFFNPKVTQQLKETLRDEISKVGDDSKRKMIEEIFKDSQAMIDKERPFTPPFTKLVPMTKSLDRTSVEKDENIYIIGKENETHHDQNKLVDSLDAVGVGNKGDLIYDQVLGCYYDPKTNMYYELKN